jgi:hypothetical protein
LREIEDGPIEGLRDWATRHQRLFTVPAAAEGAFVARVYSVPHFQQNIEQQKILKGGKNADAFVIAKAAVESGTVVTMELLKGNAVKDTEHLRPLRYSVPFLRNRKVHGRRGMAVLNEPISGRPQAQWLTKT